MGGLSTFWDLIPEIGENGSKYQKTLNTVSANCPNTPILDL